MAILAFMPKSLFVKLKKSLPRVLRRKEGDNRSDRPEQSSSTPTVPPKNDKCYLLELPPELRNRIYEYALADSFPIIWLRDRGKPRIYKGAAQPPIARVCKQLRNETLTMFYALTPFCFVASPLPRNSKKKIKENVLAPLAPYTHFIKEMKIEIRKPGHDQLPITEVYFDFHERILYAKLEEWSILHHGYLLDSNTFAAARDPDQELSPAQVTRLHAAAKLLSKALRRRGREGGVSSDEIVEVIQTLRLPV